MGFVVPRETGHGDSLGVRPIVAIQVLSPESIACRSEGDEEVVKAA